MLVIYTNVCVSTNIYFKNANISINIVGVNIMNESLIFKTNTKYYFT